VDGTTIKVAREGFRAFDESFAFAFAFAVWLEAKLPASWRELAMADNIVNDLPSPISSARIPPLASRRSGASDFVNTCWKLSHNQLHIPSSRSIVRAY
jgi:hypothetical protein